MAYLNFKESKNAKYNDFFIKIERKLTTISSYKIWNQYNILTYVKPKSLISFKVPPIPRRRGALQQDPSVVLVAPYPDNKSIRPEHPERVHHVELPLSIEGSF